MKGRFIRSLGAVAYQRYIPEHVPVLGTAGCDDPVRAPSETIAASFSARTQCSAVKLGRPVLGGHAPPTAVPAARAVRGALAPGAAHARIALRESVPFPNLISWHCKAPPATSIVRPTERPVIAGLGVAIHANSTHTVPAVTESAVRIIKTHSPSQGPAHVPKPAPRRHQAGRQRGFPIDIGSSASRCRLGFGGEALANRLALVEVGEPRLIHEILGPRPTSWVEPSVDKHGTALVRASQTNRDFGRRRIVRLLALAADGEAAKKNFPPGDCRNDNVVAEVPPRLRDPHQTCRRLPAERTDRTAQRWRCRPRNQIRAVRGAHGDRGARRGGRHCLPHLTTARGVVDGVVDRGRRGQRCGNIIVGHRHHLVGSEVLARRKLRRRYAPKLPNMAECRISAVCDEIARPAQQPRSLLTLCTDDVRLHGRAAAHAGGTFVPRCR